MYYLILLLCVAALFYYIYRRRKYDIPDTPAHDQEAKPSRKWAFNGLLDIDNPPDGLEPFDNYGATLQMRVKPGYMHYDLIPDQSLGDNDLGLFFVNVRTAPDGHLTVWYKDRCIGQLPEGQARLYDDLAKAGGKTNDAYAFVAKRMVKGDARYFGEVAVAVAKD